MKYEFLPQPDLMKLAAELLTFEGPEADPEAIDAVEQEVIISFAGRKVTYDFADLSKITLAWSISIHKSKGSEYPVVILPIYMTHAIMLTRNLIDTRLTRAKKLAIAIGSTQAINRAVKQVDQQARHTRLKERLEIRKILWAIACWSSPHQQNQ